MEDQVVVEYTTHSLPRQLPCTKIYASPNVALMEPTMSSYKERVVSDEVASDTDSLSKDQTKLYAGMLELVLVAIASMFFAYMSITRLKYFENLAFNLTARAPSDLQIIVWEMSMSVTLATLLCSIACFFIASLQLYFALKILKQDVGSPKVALNFLHEGKLIRLPTVFMFFVCALAFLITLLTSLVFMPSTIGVIPRSISCIIGVILTTFCSFAALHSAHTFFKIDNYGSSLSMSHSPSRYSLSNRYSTLV